MAAVRVFRRLATKALPGVGGWSGVNESVASRARSVQGVLLLRPLDGFVLERSLASGAGSNLQLIKQLREESSAPVTEVKAALEESGWDIEKAHIVLRKRGIAQAEKKKSKRTATEGLVGVATNESGTRAALVEVNCETDFVSRNESFQNLAGQAARALLASPHGSVATVPGSDILALGTDGDKGATVEEALTNVGLAIREKLEVRRGQIMESENGVVATYLHMSQAPSVGSIGSLVRLEAGDGEQIGDKTPEVLAVGKKVAMHVAAASPQYLCENSVPTEALEAEKEVLRNLPGVAEKPANIVEKMITGRLNKFLKQVTLVSQPFVMDDSVSVKAFVEKEGKKLGLNLTIKSFGRFKVGEGIAADKEE
ncbi:elongation factor Ts [Chloropicon primus]|uniref:Elongation factor Ts, mitochondrial n=1 Tax=Chloropicon primus TaxID=1764295 RepID=A0A5B8MVN7_9CHLO|nr:elongation factor Ts [Chloropicon primus]UPR02888.1 elongation factor Ts [Chloropicon primus]|mmetsp:Transcript_3963/g.11518  ORF Transcript_3963/g.11518 Transcript_3963/m.11518 type:complete len:369 (+) Transcript_3963:392-1498(+)|eukprot:QDZ23675.1 elongation factor Ts [Chloropicon primus]